MSSARAATPSGKQRLTAHLRAARKRLLYTGGGLPVQVRWNHLAHAEEQPALLTTAKSLLTDLCLPARNPYSSVDPPGEDVVPHCKHSLMALPASQTCFSYSLIPRNTPPCTGAMVRLRLVAENHTTLMATNDQYLEAAAVGDVEKFLRLGLRGIR